MSLITQPFKALIIGSSGAIGSAFVDVLQNTPNCTEVIGIHRHSTISIDYQNPDSIAQAAVALAGHGTFQLIINTIGVLHSEKWMPEKRLESLNFDQLTEQFNINTIGPALTIKSFSRLLDPKYAMMVTLSARAGSIEDNQLGGWYSYRASKAALNMIIKTAAIELRRTKPNVALIAMHPGMVNSSLSKPYGGESMGQSPKAAAQQMLDVVKNLSIEQSGSFISHENEILTW